MSDVFEKYRKYYQNKGGQNEIKVTVEEVRPGDSPLYAMPDEEIYYSPVVPDPPEDVAKMIRQLLDQESHLRNQREKYRMNYYKLEAKKAGKEELIKNYRIIQTLTDQMAPVYILRRKLETTGIIEEVKNLTQDEENAIRRLKYDKKRLIDRKSKLQAKISGHLAKANGLKNLPQWEADMELVKLNIYELEEEIRKIQEQ